MHIDLVNWWYFFLINGIGYPYWLIFQAWLSYQWVHSHLNNYDFLHLIWHFILLCTTFISSRTVRKTVPVFSFCIIYFFYSICNAFRQCLDFITGIDNNYYKVHWIIDSDKKFISICVFRFLTKCGNDLIWCCLKTHYYLDYHLHIRVQCRKPSVSVSTIIVYNKKIYRNGAWFLMIDYILHNRL